MLGAMGKEILCALAALLAEGIARNHPLLMETSERVSWLDMSSGGLTVSASRQAIMRPPIGCSASPPARCRGRNSLPGSASVPCRADRLSGRLISPPNHARPHGLGRAPAL